MTVRQPPLGRVRRYPLPLVLLRCRPQRLSQIPRHPPVWAENPRPDVTVHRIPLQRVHPSSIVVQRHAQAPTLALEVRGHTPLVDPLVRIVHEAVLRVPERHVRYPRLPVGYSHGRVPAPRFAPLRDVVHHALPRRVQRRLGRVLVVHPLDDVDLAIDRPVGLVGEPERGPGAAASGHVAEVDDEEASVEAASTLEAEGVAWAPGGGGGGEEDECLFRCGRVRGVGREGVRVEGLEARRRAVVLRQRAWEEASSFGVLLLGDLLLIFFLLLLSFYLSRLLGRLLPPQLVQERHVLREPVLLRPWVPLLVHLNHALLGHLLSDHLRDPQPEALLPRHVGDVPVAPRRVLPGVEVVVLPEVLADLRLDHAIFAQGLAGGTDREGPEQHCGKE
mmetsp:Transcript_28729/g.60948  ORF Transcript_28729/g.60948 Transcript_28729/m.60948 type:complete len:390 (-) Transcript_28729:897-2066(-)